MATGSVATPAERRLDGAIWASGDGRSWRRVTERAGFENTAVTQVLRRADGMLLAVGANCAFESECAGVRTWTSPDGTRWTPLAPNLPPTAFVRVIPGGPGWIAVGTETEPDGWAGAWTSSDGAIWQPAAGMGGIQIVLHGVVATRFGFVAYGTAGRGGPGAEPAIWTSRNGARWNRVPRRSAPTGIRGEALAIRNGLLVALARSTRGIEVWTSQNGTNWRHRAGAGARFEVDNLRAIRISRLISGGPGLIAFGSAEVPTQREPVGVWTSRDGIRWQPAPDVTAFQDADPVFDAAQFRGEILAVGRLTCTTDPCPMRPTFWVSPPR